ncbi:MAG: FtsX-like permease family protein [Lachnospiraceae bacterium]|nr:FtsX-like permease family protein [Lachnospiraceae bacterium]
MKNPLRKRLLRDLKSEFGKYFVIFLLITATIGFVSGFLVADGSLMNAYRSSFTKYNIEDGHFITTNKLSNYEQDSIEKSDITLYDNFYVEKELTNDSILRIFSNRDKINKVCLMEGKLPTKEHEIAIDRMYADNQKITIGDTLESEDTVWTVTGLVALSDYSALFSDNNDSMFDAVKFGVAIVTKKEFNNLGKKQLQYCYSWKYEHKPANEIEEKKVSEDLMKVVNKEVTLNSFVPQYQNQAIQFTGEDMGSDRAMMIILLYIIMTIMAFVFAITTNNTIVKEANVIGTLRASGYTKQELLRHYLTMPMLVSFTGAVIGNIIGYTIMKHVCVNMYYGSYSLPTYVTLWNAEAFLLTTVVPLLFMLVINLIILSRKLALSPLKFLRRDLSRTKQQRVVHLNHRLPFFSRFRLRILFQNISNYCILFIGILFANLLLIFGLALPAVLNHYQTEIEKNLLCKYQYMLQMPIELASFDTTDKDFDIMNLSTSSLLPAMFFKYSVETTNSDAEKFSAYSLKTLDTKYKSEEILLYGINTNSRYIDLNLKKNDVYISSAYAEKYQLEIGDIISLKESYEDAKYQFKITGIYPYEGGLCLFMKQKKLNHTFDFDEDTFSGYFSNSEITDIDEKYIGSTITLDDLTKISRQLNVSMGQMMYLVDGFAILIFIVLIYLLSKMIIEKNEQSISMVKILGYNNKEISQLYIMSTSIMVILFLLLSLPIESMIMEYLFRTIMLESMTGWITYYISPMIYVKMFVLGICTYGMVALLEFRKIQKVPMDTALKNIE